jgi:putative NADPH-quinone reductase
MKVLVLDGHPDEGRLTTHLLDTYCQALPPSAAVTRVAVRDLAFTPILRHGYTKRTEWEPARSLRPKAPEKKQPRLAAFLKRGVSP